MPDDIFLLTFYFYSLFFFACLTVLRTLDLRIVDNGNSFVDALFTNVGATRRILRHIAAILKDAIY